MLGVAHVELANASTVLLTLPQAALYRPQFPEVLSVTLPAAALVSARDVVAESVLVLSSGGTSARLAGTLLALPHEGKVQSTGSSITLTLTGDTFRPLSADVTAAVLSGIAAAQSNNPVATGWNALVAAAVALGTVTLSLEPGNRSLTVVVPALPAYDISQPETISVTIPAAATVSGVTDFACNPSVVVRPKSAVLSGSMVGGVDEAAVRTSALELTIALAADEFSSDLGGDTASTSALLDSLGGQLRAGASYSDVTVLSSTVVRVNFAAGSRSGYEISAPQTVSLVLPASTLRSNVILVVSPAFAIRAQPGSATLDAPSVIYEADMRQAAVTYEVRVDLSGDTWVDSIGAEGAATEGLLQGFLSSQAGDTGWNKIVRAALGASSLTRLLTAGGAPSGSVKLLLGGFSAFDIQAPETVQLRIPGDAVLADQPRRNHIALA